MPSISELKAEALKFRSLIESCDKPSTRLVLDDFPVMACKLTSMLLCYHYLTLWPDIEVTGFGGGAKDRDKVTHYWLEVDGIAIDITGDQYNQIDESELCASIVKKRPFDAVHVQHVRDSFLYALFRESDRDIFVQGFPTIGDDFIDQMEIGYSQLHNQVQCT